MQSGTLYNIILNIHTKKNNNTIVNIFIFLSNATKRY